MAEMFVSGVSAALWLAGLIIGLALIAAAFGAFRIAIDALRRQLFLRSLRKAQASVAKKAREGKL